MSGFGHYTRTADELEREIVKRGIAIGVDWQDQARMRDLARQALSCSSDCMMKLLRSPVRQEKLTGELFALSELMLENMRQSAEMGLHTHGGPAWKAFGRALNEEYDAGIRRPAPKEGLQA
ncbi:MAG: hypothetical protein RBT67_03805 [Thauera sp.]|jgi:hypothetical protein|nr:hypothetical protein [Thauera sp.]